MTGRGMDLELALVESQCPQSSISLKVVQMLCHLQVVQMRCTKFGGQLTR